VRLLSPRRDEHDDDHDESREHCAARAAEHRGEDRVRVTFVRGGRH
jgi:hypothetical protein